MNFDFCVCESPEHCIDVKVDTIYNICGNKSYSVVHAPLETEKYILIYTLAGNGCIKTDNLTFTLTDYEMLLIKPTDYFTYWCSSDHWNFWWIEFWSDNLPLEMNHKYKVVTTELELMLFQKSLDLLKQGKEKLSSSIVGGIISLMLMNIDENKPTEHTLEIFNKADTTIRSRLSTITVAQLAKHLNISDRTLRNIFHKCAYLSPQQYIDNIKLANARFMLENTSMAMSEIALTLGYCTQFYFTQVFSNKYGIPPSKYRNYFRVKEECYSPNL